ncbi:hypothetical protein I3271_09345 [Photobacterium leiognathi]|uniref:hypothetical protein n=1 Tax=Photobacterium leiognathi TaxID=553611 RepID=UPI001EDCE538|nr:hypothetical protein [Photobacterium leiognathi]MCG3884892.1 hypothetical protein [Photobacterium leiognathi]
MKNNELKGSDTVQASPLTRGVAVRDPFLFPSKENVISRNKQERNALLLMEDLGLVSDNTKSSKSERGRVRSHDKGLER